MSSEYGTVMVATLAVPFEEFESGLHTLEPPAGRRLSHVMNSDDGTTVVGVFIFDSKESYLALADKPEQAEWYATNIAPKIVGEAVWHDGFITSDS
jgi:hypothetical protein